MKLASFMRYACFNRKKLISKGFNLLFKRKLERINHIGYSEYPL